MKSSFFVKQLCLLAGISVMSLLNASAADTDVFGIAQLMPSADPPLEWNSKHWAEGNARNLSQNEVDPVDPTGWSRPRGDLNLFEIDGEGVLHMGGTQPRIYIQGTDENPVFFRDVEFTGYFRRVGTDGPFNGGLMVGVRNSVNGHGQDNCEASTYYGGIRYPGTWVFYKELFHPEGATGLSGKLFSGDMPSDRWIGMKYLAYNLPGNEAVKLEIYIDTVTNGEPADGGVWEKVAEIVDDGNWPVPVGDCGYPENTIVTEGGGVVFIRNTSTAEAQYKMLSFREIQLDVTITSAPVKPHEALRTSWQAGGHAIILDGGNIQSFVSITDLQGKRIGSGQCSGTGSCHILLDVLPQGPAVIRLDSDNGRRLLLAPPVW